MTRGADGRSRFIPKCPVNTTKPIVRKMSADKVQVQFEKTSWGLQKCGPDKLMIKMGVNSSKIRVLKGGRTFVWPNQKVRFLSLNLMDVRMESEQVVCNDGVEVSAVGRCTFRIDKANIPRAMELYYGKTLQEIQEVAERTLCGVQRLIISKMDPYELFTNRRKFDEMVNELAKPEMANIGLSIVTYRLVEVTGKDGYFELLEEFKMDEKKEGVDDASGDGDDATTQRKQEKLKFEKRARERGVIAEDVEYEDSDCEVEGLAEGKDKESDDDAILVEGEPTIGAVRRRELKEEELTSDEQVTGPLYKCNVIAHLNHELRKQGVPSGPKDMEAKFSLTMDKRGLTLQVNEDRIRLQFLEKQLETSIQALENRRKELELEASVCKPALAKRLAEELVAEAERKRLILEAEAEAVAAALEADAHEFVTREMNVAKLDVLRSQAAAYDRYGDAAMEELRLDTWIRTFKEINSSLNDLRIRSLTSRENELGLATVIREIQEIATSVVKSVTGD